MPSIRQGWSFGLEWRKFILFLSVGKSWKGKSSFAILGLALDGADCKCAFSCAVANCFLLVVAPAKSNFSEVKILFAVSNFIVAVDNFINEVVKILNVVNNFMFEYVRIIVSVCNFINAVGKSIKSVGNFTNDVTKIILLPCTILIFLDYFKF